MLHMYKNMHYIYINIYTMCKTYGVQRTRGMARGGGDKGGGSATLKDVNQLMGVEKLGASPVLYTHVPPF